MMSIVKDIFVNGNWFKHSFVVRLALIGILFATPLFFVSEPDERTGPLLNAIWNCGHILFFFAVAVYVNSIYPLNTWRSWIIFSLVIFVGGSLIEIIQGLTGRDADVNDVIRDLAGSWLGLFFLQPSSRIAWGGRFIAFLLVIPSLLDVYQGATIEYYANKEFPLLAGFEHATDLKRWYGRISLSQEFFSEGKNSLKIEFTTAEYSGAKLVKSLGNWRGYKKLSVDLYNPQDESLSLVLRIHDLKHEQGANNLSDRFNERINLAPGWNHFSFSMDSIEHAPKDRLMDLEKIMAIELFSVRLSKPKAVYLDNLKLE